MRLKNTSEIPDAVVREAVKFVRSMVAFCGGLRLTVRKTQSGRLSGHSWPTCRPPRVVATIPECPRPVMHRSRGSNVRYHLADRAETLVAVLAHEFRHLWQGQGTVAYSGKRKRAGMAWGARGRFSEQDCEATALRVLRAWRRRETK